MRSVLALLLWCLALPAAAQTVRQEVYEGTIGKSPVVIEILTYRDGPRTLRSARYFYAKYRTPISLTHASGLTFSEADPACFDTECPSTATIALKAAGTGLSGTWKATGKTAQVAVMLSPVGARDYPVTQDVREAASLPSVMDSEEVLAASNGDPFRQKLYDAALAEGPETPSNGLGYRIVTDRATGVRYVRLTRHPDTAMLKTVNARLDAHRHRNQSYALECADLLKENGQGPGHGGYEDTSVKVAHLTPAMMFVEEAGSTYCGGAHPNNFWTLTGYDLRTGRGLDMNTLLRLYDTPPGAEPSETAQFQALKAKLEPSSPWFVAGADIPDCLAEDLGYPYTLSFNAKGLVFSLTDLPHVMGACMGEYYVVPYAELKTLWRPEAKAYIPGL